MNELKKKISALIYNYFDEKIAHFNFYDDTYTEGQIQDLVDDLQGLIEDGLSDTDRAIDGIIEDFDSTEARREWIKNQKIDQAYEDYKDTNFEHGLFLSR